MKRQYILVVWLALVVSCNLDKSSITVGKQENVLDSLFSGYALDSIDKKFYENGIIKEARGLLNNKEHGKIISFYEEGKVQIIKEVWEGVSNGKSTSFYKDHSLRQFELYDLKGNLRFIMEFDKDGKLVYKDGKCLYVATPRKKNNLQIGEKVSLPVYIAFSESFESQVTMGVLYKKKLFNMQSFKVKEKYPLFQYSFDTSGIRTMQVVGEVRKDSIIISSDTVQFTINVNQ